MPDRSGSAVDPSDTGRRRGRRRRAVVRGGVAVVLVAVAAGSAALVAYGVPGVSCRAVPVPMTPAAPQPATGRPPLQHVVVVAMENTGARQVYSGGKAPYLRSLLAAGAHATDYRDPLAQGVLSEPHYLWMEAGTNRFGDTSFCNDRAPSAKNSTASTDHLTTQMASAIRPVSWRSYQEGLDPATTGACPVRAAGHYAPKHDPFVFFQDIAGSPPSGTAARCAEHHRPASRLAADVAAGDVAEYTFVTPDLCHDMHDTCGSNGRVASGDAWLRDHLPALVEFAGANHGVVFVVWDEGDAASRTMPFVALGPSVAAGRASAVTVTHGSLLRTIETMFDLPLLPTVAGASDLSDLFVGGVLPLRA